jgi:hypothetical protein
MRLIVEQDIRHDGGAVGAQLITSLQTLVAMVMGTPARLPERVD